MDMNMNVFWRNPKRVSERQTERMTRFWGDNSWRKAAYSKPHKVSLKKWKKRLPMSEVAEGVSGSRLKEVAGFKHVPKPMPMRNSKISHCLLPVLCGSRTNRRQDRERHLRSTQAIRRESPMAEHSTIEWTDATWNPVRGCTKISPGCKHCYAEVFAERFRGVPGHPYEQGFDLDWFRKSSLSRCAGRRRR